MSKTPYTDAAAYDSQPGHPLIPDGVMVVPVKISRDLEINLAKARAKIIRQRTELRRLNKTLRAMWDGVRFSHKCKREMEARARP